ncbi:MAG: hypothetical protein MHMPM18_003581 [Marteilia pararefringens]
MSFVALSSNIILLNNNRLVSVDKSGCCCGVPIKNSGNIPFLLKCAVEYPKSSGNKNNINQSYITLSKDSYALNPNEQALIKVFFRKAPDQNEFESYFYLVLSTDPGGQIYRVRFTTELVKRTMNCELKYYVLCSHKSVYFGLVPLNESQIKTIKLKNGSSFNELQVDLLIKEESRNEFFLQTESSSTLLSAKVDLKIPPNESTTLKIHFIPNSTGFLSTNLAIKNNIDGTSHSIPLCGYGGDISVHFSDCEILDGTLSVAYGSTSATTRSLLVKNQGNIPLFILHKSKSDNKTKIIKLAVAAESKIERICYDDILSFGSSDMRDFFLQTCKDQDIKKFLDLPLLSKLFEDLSIQYQQFQDGNEIKTSHIDPRQLKIFPNDHIEFLKSLKYLTINFKNQVDNNISILKMSPNVIILKNLQPADDNFLNISNLTDKKIKIEFKEHNFLKSSENLFDIDGFSKKRISISCLPKFFPLHNFTETSLEFVANESNINHVKIFLINDCSNLIQYMENVVINSNNSKLKIINLLNIPLQFAFSYVTPNISHFHFEPSSGTLNALETKWVNILCRNQSECEERLFINICFKDTLIYSYPLHIVKTVDVSILGNKNNTENDIPFDENQGCKILSIRHEKDCNETIEYEHKKCIYALRNVITLANNQSQSKNSYREFHIKLINRCKLSDHTIVISKISHGLRCSYQQVKIKLDHFIRLPVQLDLSEVNKANTNQIDSERPTVSFETDYGEKIECEVKI